MQWVNLRIFPKTMLFIHCLMKVKECIWILLSSRFLPKPYLFSGIFGLETLAEQRIGEVVREWITHFLIVVIAQFLMAGVHRARGRHLVFWRIEVILGATSQYIADLRYFIEYFVLILLRVLLKVEHLGQWVALKNARLCRWKSDNCFIIVLQVFFYYWSTDLIVSFLILNWYKVVRLFCFTLPLSLCWIFLDCSSPHSVYKLESGACLLVIDHLCLLLSETAKDAISHVIVNKWNATKLHQTIECSYFHSPFTLAINLF